MENIFALILSVAVLSIPITAIVLSYRQKAQKNKILEIELQNKKLQLEIEKQNSTIKLLEEENKKMDRLIN